MNGTLSNYYGLNVAKELNKFGSIYFSTMMGLSELDNFKNTFISESSELLSSSFEFNYESNSIFDNNKLKISLSQPNRVEKGDMTFRLIGLADKDGNIPYNDHVIDLSPSGRQIDLSIGYYTEHSKNLKTGIKTIFTDDLGHRKSDNLDSNILFTASYIF